ncbi:tetratricopeptide repeat protein (plasmid) [Streptomyces sp. NBC_01724]|uniref:tetratricopeptide repeat protein n=1 Tax=Streptomyces sp. NBC_01724 TaxID=2975922 RepID=UPI002E3212F4|nr:tetratricopeptide repeat protein [Streptomyces sp. NBC_01724]
MGRRAQVSLFVENLARDPLSEGDPAEFLFHVRGVGGVGKSTLLRQWREAAQRAGALTAVVDENDVHGVPQALSEVVRQLAEEAGPLKGFDRAAEQFRREQETAAETAPPEGTGAAEGGASLSSRLVTQATLGAVSMVPGASVVTAMANPEAAAQVLDRLRAGVGAGARGRRGRGGDVAALSRAFVAELDRLCGQDRWVVLFFDTWEQTGRYLDGWVRDLLQDTFGLLPANVMVVLAGRDELAEREWAPLRALIADVPLEVFTEAETRALLAARGVTEPGAVEAVLQLSMGLPLLVELCALSRPATAEGVDRGGDAVDAAVERFVQWIGDSRQREAVLACALAPQLNEDVFAAAAPGEAQGLWGWLCGQPFVSGHGDFKQYHAVVRASMVRSERTHSPQRWATAHLRLADAHFAWRADAEQAVPEAKRWGDPRWRQHRLAETFHQLCAYPAAGLEAALEQTAHAAGQDVAALRQWTDTLEQAARDTADPTLLAWAERLQNAAADNDPSLASLTALLTHAHLTPATRAWVHTYRGRRLYLADHGEEALAELDRAIAAAPHNHHALAYRGDVYRSLGRFEEAIADLTAALDLEPTHAWALVQRGETHRLAGRLDEAIADLTAALDLDPTYAWALAARGYAHELAGRFDGAIADFTAAFDLDPTDSLALVLRGEAHRLAGRFDEAIADQTAALDLDPTDALAYSARGEAHQQAGRLDEAVADQTAALDLDPTYASALVQRGRTHRLARRFDEAIADFTAAFGLEPTLALALTERGEAHRLAGRFDEAVADQTAALDLEPSYALAFVCRGHAHRQAGRLDEAVADLTAAFVLDPTYALALVQRGRTHRLARRFDEAVADFTAAFGLEPTLALALTERGETHRLAGRLDEAIADLTAALDLDPTDALAFDSRGEAHQQAGRLDAAVADFTAALDLDPTYAWSLVQRGATHRQAGRLDEAIADLTAALDLDPTHAWALIERGKTHRQAGRYSLAQEDFERAAASQPDNPDLPFAKLLLDTVTLGPAACAERWTKLLDSPVETAHEDATRFFGLFRVLLLEPGNNVAEATEVFLSAADQDTVTELHQYLAEFSTLGGELAGRARQCLQLIVDHAPE